LTCDNGILALGAMDVIRSEFGLGIPHELAIIGFANIGLERPSANKA
jgi:DNA-binding LacI/PurR family transcriptional regulator